MITKELQATLLAALGEARKRRHEHLCVEHILYSLTNEQTGSRILRACAVDIPQLRKELEAFFQDKLSPLPEGVEREPEQTLAIQRVLHRAIMHMQSSGKAEIDSGSVLAAMFREKDSHAVYLLQKQGVRRLDVIKYLSHGLRKEGAPDDDDERSLAVAGGESAEKDGEDGEEGEDGEDGEGKGRKKTVLEKYTVNLVEEAKAGRIDPLVGRASEITRTIQVLCRRRKNNPLYVGDAGVGKTALAEGLAWKIVRGEVPEVLKDVTVFSLDMGGLIAGTKFRGEFEERLKGVVNALRKRPGSVLFIDEIHTIIGAGAVSGGSMDASNLLKPALAAGELRCIGSTTFEEYKSVFEKDRALARRFQKIDVLEPTIDETFQILKGLRSRYEDHHGVHYTDPALRAAADLAAKHINDRHLPDKAIDVMDEAGAAMRLSPPSGRKRTVRPADIEQVVARMARIPPKTVSADDKTQLQSLEQELKKVIYGQDAAIDSLVTAIKLSRSGLGSPDKPVGCFLFSGPTGVGKTELAKQLARVLGVEFIRFDMSEYMEKHTVSRLIGAPPGYVGFDQGGLLTDAIRKTPHTVLVLDEIEKAHPDIYNVLLQVMDHATLTDNNGRKADFRNVVLVMTTNAGARELQQGTIGFAGGAGTSKSLDKTAIERTFSPEFRNRLDAWITFHSLAPDVIRKVVDKFTGQLAEQLKEKKVVIELSPAAKSYLAEKGYDRLYGARPMARLIQNEIKKPLADALLFGALQSGGLVLVDVEGGKLVLNASPPALPEGKHDGKSDAKGDAKGDAKTSAKGDSKSDGSAESA
jgi:ATP-dependent Clp protease ATP-binding subunit ClpA